MHRCTSAACRSAYASILTCLCGWLPAHMCLRAQVYASCCLRELPGCLFVVTNVDPNDNLGQPTKAPFDQVCAWDGGVCKIPMDQQGGPSHCGAAPVLWGALKCAWCRWHTGVPKQRLHWAWESRAQRMYSLFKEIILLSFSPAACFLFSTLRMWALACSTHTHTVGWHWWLECMAGSGSAVPWAFRSTQAHASLAPLLCSVCDCRPSAA